MTLSSLTHEELLNSVFFVQLHGAYVDLQQNEDIVLSTRSNTVCIIALDKSNAIHHHRNKPTTPPADPQETNKQLCDLLGSGNLNRMQGMM